MKIVSTPNSHGGIIRNVNCTDQVQCSSVQLSAIQRWKIKILVHSAYNSCFLECWCFFCCFFLPKIILKKIYFNGLKFLYRIIFFFLCLLQCSAPVFKLVICGYKPQQSVETNLIRGSIKVSSGRVAFFFLSKSTHFQDFQIAVNTFARTLRIGEKLETFPTKKDS